MVSVRVCWIAIALLYTGCKPAAIPPLAVSSESELPTSCNGLAVDAVHAGWDLLDRGEREGALRYFEKASRNDPDCTIALAHRGVLMSGVEGEHLLADARHRARTLPPAERIEVELLASVRAGDAVAALSHQARLAEIHPQSWRAQFLFGRRLGSFRRFEEAEAALVRATELAPDRAAPFELLGWTRLESMRDPVGALGPLTRWVELSPDDAKAHRVLGACLALNGRLVEAEAALRRSIALRPTSEAWDRLSWVLALKGDRDATRIALNEWSRVAIGDGPMRSRAHLAWLRFEEGKLEEALDALRETETLAGSGFEQTAARMTRGVMLTLAGRHEDALQALASAEALRESAPLPADDCGDSLMWMWLRAKVHAEVRSGDGARAARTRDEIRSMPSDYRFREALLQFAEGQILRGAGELARADEHFAVCAPVDTWCAAERIAVATGMGDAAKAAALRIALREGVRQEPLYLYFRSANRPAGENR